MTAVYPTSVLPRDFFLGADEHYSMMKEQVRSVAWGELDHGEVERRLARDGLELMRRLLQSHFRLRGRARPVEAVIGADGIERTHVRRGTHREITTIFGSVDAEREAYSARGASALHPVDADLNLPSDKYSHEVQRQVALNAAEVSFDSTIRSLERSTAASVGKFQVEQLAQKAAADFEAFYEGRTFSQRAIQKTASLLILSFDQKGVVLRPEDLRDATRKIAEGNLRKLQTRHSKGEPHGRKRMATVATVYTVEEHHRTAMDVIKGLRRIRDVAPGPKPRPEFKRLWASLESTPQEVIAAGFDEALKRDPDRKKKWYVLIDGDDDLERWVKQAAKRSCVEVTIGLDFIHALQYLWKAGKVFHNEGTPELEEWVLERLHNILLGKASDVAAGMRRSATLREIRKDDREPVDRCAGYFLARTHLMKYDDLLASGAPIATGVVEGGCKYLVNDRLDVTGARWSLIGAEAILRLRALVISDDFDDYWTFHECETKKRTHLSRYANCRAPTVELVPRTTPCLKVLKS